MKLAGCYTAIVTPFQDGKVHEETLTKLVERQVKGGVDGIVPMGTTGESPTVDFDEHQRVIELVQQTVAGRCAVVAGTGGNATDEAVRLTRHAASIGVDASLQVTPYYNKPTAEGLYRHFSTVADTCGLPIVLYNVPGRTGTEIPVEVIARLARHPLVVAVKEAGGSVDRVSAILNACDITVLSGDDSLTLPMMAVGGTGVISVASNVVPAKVTAMVHAALSGNWDQAREAHGALYPLFRDLFLETNPIPVKAALAILGELAEEYRLPLCPMSPENRKTLERTMREIGILN